MKKIFIVLMLLIATSVYGTNDGAELVVENYWNYLPFVPASLTSYTTIHAIWYDAIYYTHGSNSVNYDPTVVETANENLSFAQGTFEIWVRLNNEPMPYHDPRKYYWQTLYESEWHRVSDRFIICFNNSILYFINYKDNLHSVYLDVSDWVPGSWHHICAVYDWNNTVFGSNYMTLYIDGANAGAVYSGTTTNTDMADYIGTNFYGVGGYGHEEISDSGIAQVCGLQWTRVLDRALTSTEISALYNSGAGSANSFLVTPNTKYLSLVQEETNSIVYHHFGKLVSSITAGGTEATLTSAAGTDNVFVDNDRSVVYDTIGCSKLGYVDGTPSSTSIDMDNGAGAAVTDIEDIGVWYDFNQNDTVAVAANNTIHDLTTEDIGVWAIVKVNSSISAFNIIQKGYFIPTGPTKQQGYYFTVEPSTGVVRLKLYDENGVHDYILNLDGNTDIRDDRWHHIAAIVDRSNEANCKIYLDGYEDGTTNKSYSDIGTLSDITTLTNTFVLGIGVNTTPGVEVDGCIAEIGFCSPTDIMAAGEMGEAGAVLTLALNPRNPSAWCNTEDYWLLDENTGTTLTGQNNNLTLSGDAGWDQRAFISRNLISDGDMDNSVIGAWTLVGTPTILDKETDTDYNDYSLHFVSDAANEGFSQTVAATNGDKYYLYTQYKVAAGSFDINVTNGGGVLGNSLSDSSWANSEVIVSATGNLTIQYLSEASGDDVNISKVELLPCITGDTLVAGRRYSLVYNTDTTDTGITWSGLGSDATEVAAGDLYIRDDAVDAMVETKGDGVYPDNLWQIDE